MEAESIVGRKRKEGIEEAVFTHSRTEALRVFEEFDAGNASPELIGLNLKQGRIDVGKGFARDGSDPDEEGLADDLVVNECRGGGLAVTCFKSELIISRLAEIDAGIQGVRILNDGKERALQKGPTIIEVGTGWEAVVADDSGELRESRAEGLRWL